MTPLEIQIQNLAAQEGLCKEAKRHVLCALRSQHLAGLLPEEAGLTSGQMKYKRVQARVLRDFPPEFSRLCVTRSQCNSACLIRLMPGYRHGRNAGKQWTQLLRLRDGDCCHYCGGELSFSGWNGQGTLIASVDHVVPVCRGGTDEISNLVLACLGCNSTKQSRTYEWMIHRKRGSR